MRSARPRVNEIGDRFRAQQVQFAVQDGSLGELAGIGNTRARLD